LTRDIRRARDRLGITTAAMARLVGVSLRTAQRWINAGEEVPEPVWRLLKVCGEHPELVPDLMKMAEALHTQGVAGPYEIGIPIAKRAT
jgi:DNA-binding XRE family transcriptional regulator